MASGFDQFKGLIDRFGWIAGLMVGGSALVPLLTAAAGFAPPWPPGIEFITTMFMVVALILIFQFTVHTSRLGLSIMMVLSFILLTASLGFYLYLFDTFLFSHPDTGGLIVLGCEWTQLTRSVEGSGPECPGQFAVLLEQAEYDPYVVWTWQSIREIRFSMFLGWLGFFINLAAFIGFFAVSLTKNPTND